jgi:hypothetical protein
MKISLHNYKYNFWNCKYHYITPSWTATAFSEGYAVWIDYNKTDYLQMPVVARSKLLQQQLEQQEQSRYQLRLHGNN